MARCTDAKKAKCRAEGKVCSKKSGQCKFSETAKRARKKASMAALPSTSMVVGAVLGNVGSPTAASLVSKRRSSKLGAGMATMVAMTKDEVSRKRKRTSSGGSAPKRRRTSQSSRKMSARKMSARKMSSRKMSSRKMSSSKTSGGSQCGATCPPTAKGAMRVRLTGSCKCVVPGGKAAREAGVCLPRPLRTRTGYMYKNGSPVTYETVAVPNGRGGFSCVKAGGSVAKKELGKHGCPPGKTMKTVRLSGGAARDGYRTGQRCVKAVGALKDCRENQVLAMVPYKGGSLTNPKTGVKSTFSAGTSARCVLSKTASKHGYRVIRQGTLAAHTFVRPAMSMGM